MEQMGYLYKITNPLGKVYIGQTVCLRSRKLQYSNGRVVQQIKIHRSIQKYGWDAHSFETIFEGACSRDCLDKLERLYILQYNSVAEGLNCTEGGGGSRGRKHSEQSKAKISVALTGRKGHPHTEESRAKLSAAHKGKKLPPHTEERKAQISASLKGRKKPPRTDEHRAKISEAWRIRREGKSLNKS